jgi:hypothetical protein
MDKPTSIHLSTMRWRDRINGNSYFAARVYADGKEIARVPFQYGYGSHPGAVALSAVTEVLDCFPTGRTHFCHLSSACRAAGIEFTCDDYNGLKRDVKAHGSSCD